MKDEGIRVVVYGADVKCASCVNAPGSRETYEWLQAAIGRKFNDSHIIYAYYDIHEEKQADADHSIIQQILNGELFYPLVMIENEVVAEGDPRLKKVYQVLERHGIKQLGNL
ncbi:YuzD family protein [Halobacillus karajensis]|uniref:Disulfide oxidoreductase YuzD n=1 Tax=Halobacillus karajensis TaxID=195088 RepID=A0A024P9V8_9BACI|nr:YuzD family protein [Halobacillus karajensis]CDQ21297.1 hypothetical protein BN982_03664 [Halobacillus karajensis]CDQ25633.1 hypothetical protein BN983_03989 [Halobacillus karajensis]CDQ25904.1 hypothetical protein BN981_00110 [Halobacillus karajensis]